MRKCLLCKELLLVAILATAIFGTAEATTYYVSPSGSNSDAGTSAQPWQTVIYAATVASTGDTVLIRAGSYAGPVRPSSGSSGNPITFKAVDGDSVTIDGGSERAIDLYQRSWIVVDGLRLTFNRDNTGVIEVTSGHDVTIQNCEFFNLPSQCSGCNAAGIRVMGGGAYNIKILNNYFHDNSMSSLQSYELRDSVIEHNEIINAGAIGLKDSPDNVIVRWNYIQGGGEAFYLAGQNGANNVTITENIIKGSGRVATLSSMGTGGNYRQDLFFYNNTMYNCGRWMRIYEDGYNRNQRFWNNIFYAETPNDDDRGRIYDNNRWGGDLLTPSDWIFEYNCYQVPETAASPRKWFGNSGNFYMLPEWQGQGFELNTITGNPDMINPAGGDFRLQAGSRCIDAGSSGEDVGAYPRGDDGTIIGRLSGGLPPADTIPPSISITGPVPTGSYTTSQEEIDLSGTATDASGIASIQWENDRGGSGSGTLGWTVAGIALETGDNAITVTARDLYGNTSTDSITVTRLAPPDPDDTTPPDAPGNLGVTILSDTEIVFTWDPGHEADLAGYKMYHGSLSGDYGDPVDVGNVTAYTLAGVTGKIYGVVTAYDLSANESYYSGQVYADMTAGETGTEPIDQTGPDKPGRVAPVDDVEALQIAPNLVYQQDSVRIRFKMPAGDVVDGIEVVVLDITGSMVGASLTPVFTAAVGGTMGDVTVATEDLQTGVYVVSVTGGTVRHSGLFTVLQ